MFSVMYRFHIWLVYSNFFHKDIETIKSNRIKNTYLPFLIDEIIKKYLDRNFSSNHKYLKETYVVYYFKLPNIGKLSHHIKNKVSKEFYIENLNIKLVLIHSKLKVTFHIKTQFLMILVIPKIYVLVLTLVPATLAKLVVILKLGLKNISKRIENFIFSNIYTSPQYTLTHIILFLLKQLIKLTLNSI